MIYDHTQEGKLMKIIAAITTIIITTSIITATEQKEKTTLIITGIIILLILKEFFKLRTTITEQKITISFGTGIIKKELKTKEITSAKPVKNKWWYGWGIRIKLFPKTTIYNVSGLKAVEIKTKKGQTIRIGTDEPEKLARTINKITQKNKKF